MKRRRILSPNSQPDSSTGSPQPGEPVYLAVGRLRRTHGIEGAMLMDVLTDFPERLRAGKTLFLGDHYEPLKLTSVRKAGADMIVRFAGFNNPEEAARLRNTLVYIKAEGLPKLPEGEYYHHELLGMEVIDENGQLLGELERILETGANDVYVVKTPEGEELLLAAIEDVILKVDLAKRQITARPPEWY